MGSRLENKSNEVRKRIENHEFKDEEGEEYEPSKFGGFTDYFRRKKIKLQNLDVELRASSAGNPPIFKGVVLHVNGYTQPSLNDLHTLVVSHGGGFMQYLDGKTQVTHIVASSLTPKKVEEFRKYRIVKPAWIVDSVHAGKLLPWNSYRVVDEGAGQKVLQFDNGKITSQVNTQQRGYRDQTSTSWYTNQLNGTDNTSNIQLPTPEISSQGHGDGPRSDVDEFGKPASTDAPSHVNLAIGNGGHRLQISSLPQMHGTGFLAPPDPNPASTLQQHVQHEPELLSEADDRADQSVPNPNLKRKSVAPSQLSSARNSKLTAEEHNAILLSDPRIRKSSVLNPDFLEQYYRESRLHHLSMWKADLKAQLQAITAEKTASQKAVQKRPFGSRRYILHVDFDSFFVAVSLKNHPQYVDTPACVAHSTGNQSEIASCNYPARQFGVKNGMWMKRANELCQDLKVLPYDFPAYEAASRLFYDVIMATGGIVQSISIDEALVDATALCLLAGGSDGITFQEGSIWREQAKAEEISQHLRDEVKKETGCAVSVGIGGNILLAKTALRKAKPAGQHQVKPEDALDFIGALQVQDLPGVAYSIGGKLEEVGIKFVKDIRECTKEKLVNILGPKTGEKMWNYARANDRTEVGEQVVRKSVSAEVNWGVRFETQEQAEEFVESLCGELNGRLLKERVKGKQLTMKIMRRAADAPLDPPKHLGHGKCDTFNKSVVLGVATNAKDVLAKEALSILRFYSFPAGELRGLGVQMTKLEPIKVAAQGLELVSQQRLQFASRNQADPIEKENGRKNPTDGRPKAFQNPVQFKPAVYEPANSKILVQDDVETPKKPKGPHFIVGAVDSNSPSRKPLNTLGTQFILPTQVDPSVLAELPADIRSRLAKHSIQITGSDIEECKDDNKYKTLISSTVLPAQSQLDPEILQALPDDVRLEILAHYASSPTKRNSQALLPQSPRKTRTLPPPRNNSSNRGRPRGSNGLLSRLKGGTARNPHVSTLTQSNFVAPIQKNDQTCYPENGRSVEVDGKIAEDFLEALPEDIRREVVAQQRAEQRKRNAGIEVSGRRTRRDGGGELLANDAKKQKFGDAGHSFIVSGETGVSAVGDQKERVLVLPCKSDRPGFTMGKLSRLDDLRGAVSLWHEEFKDEGPYREDVEALLKYLRSVICNEEDMSKAVGIVKWLEWVIGDISAVAEAKKAQKRWTKALETAKECVKQAVDSRGLGAIEL